MSQQPPPDPSQRLNIDDASIQDSQFAQAGRDLTQIQGEVVNVTVCDKFDVSGWGSRQVASTVKPLTQQEYRQRQVLLNKVRNYWIEGVLEQSLHNRALIELGLEERLDSVERPGDQEIPDHHRQKLLTGIGITDVFNQMGEGRTLLILGEPGSGKTTILLKLAQDLIPRIEEDLSQPIPVVLNLSSWVIRYQTIADWLVQQLNSQYQIPNLLGEAWVEDQQLLLLLDGLDEVKAEHRKACVQALNQFIQDYGLTEMVVCSRIRDYKVLSKRLKLQGAICIQSLMPEQINQYLQRAGDQLEAVQTLLEEDTALQELATSPLTLSVMTLAYQDISVEDLPRTGSVEKRRQHLFSTYIERMFRRKRAKQKYQKAQATHWLNWLAQSMVQESKTVFLIEQMQPSLLTEKNEISAYISGLVITYLLVGSLVGKLLGLSNITLIEGLVLGVPIFWLISGGYYIRYTETLKWSGVRFCKTLNSSLIFSVVFGLLAFVLTFLTFYFFVSRLPIYVIQGTGFERVVEYPYSSSLSNALGLGTSILLISATFGIVFSLINGLTGFEIESRVIPNQGIFRSLKYSLFFALLSASTAVLIAHVIRFPVVFWVIFGIFFGTAAGGGAAVIKHLILRIVLHFYGHIPWNYARFLDYATERIFLQKVGGGYIFIHRVLMEHHARMELE